ncbi:hypothetical protein C8J56DRAFT_1173126 [Mycena floridula]|nr:hypothetical protein C8J56DRAFT_1173126 [Mycena floridula]
MANTHEATTQPAQTAAKGALNMDLSGIDPQQLLTLIQSVPGLLPKYNGEQVVSKEDAAHALSNMAQNAFASAPAHALGMQYPGIEPGPSSHPRGPPGLGLPQQQQPQHQEMEDGMSDEEKPETPAPPPTSTGGRRSRGGAAMGSDEWTRQRKDNHKEVERRRRGNINEGINELGRIVPNGSGEKAKGAILSRAVQYIHHLKENEARNIEKWTLEKLLMDQAMGDLQAQLEEVRRMWEEERQNRQRAENELENLKNQKNGPKRGSEDHGDGDEDSKKRQRTE